MSSDDYFDDLSAHEGCTTWLYCDTRGFVTIGIGNLVESAEACTRLPLTHPDGTPASDDEKRDAWTKVTNAFAANKSAAYYRPMTGIRITEDYARQLMAAKLDNVYIPGIRKLLHDFDSFPLPARKALVDMAYNLGVHGLGHFVNMISACLARDWATAAHECHRSTCRDSRNAWTAQMFVDAEVAEAVNARCA